MALLLFIISDIGCLYLDVTLDIISFLTCS